MSENVRKVRLGFGLAMVIVLILVSQCNGVAAQDPGDIIREEISEDWPTDMIVLFVQTPNKWDLTYGDEYNVTNINVLNEMSAVEEAMNPQMGDLGQEDEIFFVQSISTLVKEICVSTGNIAKAFSDELEIPVSTEQIPGDYAIPQDQEEVDDIVFQIPEEVLETFLRDTNRDGIWDSAVIIMGVRSNDREGLLNRLYTIIETYYIDERAGEGDDNSQEAWWERVDNEEVHCAMIPIEHITSYETYDGTTQVVDVWLAFLVISIMGVLLFILINFSESGDRDKGKKGPRAAVLLMVILIAVCTPFIVVDTSMSPSRELRQYSDEFGGGQVGMVLIRGNPAPEAKDEPTKGRGSMKDIGVLDDMDDMEVQIGAIDRLHLLPYTIIDIMKMIVIPENVMPDMVNQLPDIIQDRINETISQNFWDAIHLANDDETSLWYAMYGKSMQDSIINIFYNSITVEMRTTFVNHDFSKAVMYIPMPMGDKEQSEEWVMHVNEVIENYRAGHSTSDMVLVEDESLAFRNIVWFFEILIVFSFLTLGLIIFGVSFHNLRRGEEEEDVEAFIPDQDISLKEDYYFGDNIWDKPPPG